MTQKSSLGFAVHSLPTPVIERSKEMHSDNSVNDLGSKVFPRQVLK